MRHTAVVLTIGLALIIPVSSHAASTSKAREKAAKKACAAGDFRTGVEILAELYVETNEATHVFNQGRCYEQNHQWVSAIDRFREYLRQNPKATAAEKADAEKHIADCETFRGQEESRLVPPATYSPAPAPAPVVSVPPPAPAPAPPPVTIEQPKAQPEPTGSGLRVTGIVLGSVGIAAAATGLVLNLKANSLGSDYNKTQDPAKKSSYSSYKTGAFICYGAGGGMLVTGLVLYLLGRSGGSGEHASQVAVLPVLTPSQFSIAVARGF